ncbi:MAG TPA: TspO/MBR family protein [Burkholderiales bacterium]|nr:TspO/MBR family protein [Burkholderiales bacterium]
MVAALTRCRQMIGLAGWLLVSFIAAGIGAAASMRAADFYGQLNQSEWAFPASVFGPVWTVLYVLMGFAAWLVWRQSGVHATRTALALFLLQLALNALWSWPFFGWHLGALAVADVVLLWGLIVLTLLAFRRQSTAASVLLVS